MHLNHLDLQVTDVQRTARLLEELFGLELESSGPSPALAILGDGAGFTLVLQRKRTATETYPAGFHVGFLRSSADDVRAFHARAKARLHGEDEVELSEIIENGRGVLVYVRLHGELLVECSWQRGRSKPVAPLT